MNEKQKNIIDELIIKQFFRELEADKIDTQKILEIADAIIGYGLGLNFGYEQVYDVLTPLSCAIKKDSVELVNAFLSLGAKADLLVNNWKPLEHAFMKGNIQIMSALIQYGAQPTEIFRRNENIFYRYSENIKETVPFLVRHQVNINHQDENGYTPLIHAVIHADDEHIEAFIKAGASLLFRITMVTEP